MPSRSKTRDHLLVKECLSGSQEAWNEFYRRFTGLIRSVVNRYLGSTGEDLEGVSQDAFISLMSALNTYDPAHPLPKFICMITERVCIDRYRFCRAVKRHAETQPVDHHDGDENGATTLNSNIEPQDEQVARAELAYRLRLTLGNLAAKCRELLKLRYYDDLSYKEIGEILGQSANTLRVQAWRCLDELRARYEEAERKGAMPS